MQMQLMVTMYKYITAHINTNSFGYIFLLNYESNLKKLLYLIEMIIHEKRSEDENPHNKTWIPFLSFIFGRLRQLNDT